MFSKTVLASLIAAVSAHQNFHQFWVNGVTPGFQVGIRMPPSNSPVTDVTSEDIVCNVDGQTGVPDTVPANEGDTIKVQWDQSTHPGPITHMLFGPVDSAKDATGVGSWFKIDELDSVDGEWANAIMSADNMTHEFTLPTGLPSGEYLMRSEMLALHGAQEVGGAQFYIGCAQLKITGTGSAGACGPTIKLPGAYKAEDANIYIPNIYSGFDPANYTAPGGPVGSCGGNASAPVVPSPSNSTSNSTLPATSAAAVNPSVTPVAKPTVISEVAVSSVPAVATSAAGNATVQTSAPLSIALPTTLQTSVIVAPSGTAPSAPGSTGSVGGVKKYGQCGGQSYTGATVCVSGTTCKAMNEYYSQCI